MESWHDSPTVSLRYMRLGNRVVALGEAHKRPVWMSRGLCLPKTDTWLIACDVFRHWCSLHSSDSILLLDEKPYNLPILHHLAGRSPNLDGHIRVGSSPAAGPCMRYGAPGLRPIHARIAWNLDSGLVVPYPWRRAYVPSRWYWLSIPMSGTVSGHS